MVGGGGAVCLR